VNLLLALVNLQASAIESVAIELSEEIEFFTASGSFPASIYTFSVGSASSGVGA